MRHGECRLGIGQTNRNKMSVKRKLKGKGGQEGILHITSLVLSSAKGALRVLLSRGSSVRWECITKSKSVSPSSFKFE